jgi:mRNA interferase MazF
VVRGEIFFVHLEPRSGSEQAGVRPCLLVSHDAFNGTAGWRSLTVLPLTSSPRWLKASPTTVLIPAGEANLPRDSAILAHQITTVDRSKLQLPAVGRLGPERMAQVHVALENYLALG